MDIALLSIAMSQSSTSVSVSTAITKKILDSANESSQQLIQAMGQSTNPNIGTNLDVSA